MSIENELTVKHCKRCKEYRMRTGTYICDDCLWNAKMDGYRRSIEKMG